MPSFAERARLPIQAKSEGGPSILPRRRLPTENAAAPAALPEPLRSGAEALGGFSLADVRVHRDSPEPAKLGALAFARGSDIHLGPGQERHLPHEAWHVVQQKQGRTPIAAQREGMPVNEETALEMEADRMGDAALRGSDAGAAVMQRPIGTAVTQFMVKQRDKPLKKRSTDSDTLKSYIDAPDQYYLRDDCDRKSSKIHILEEKIYVLGEKHTDFADWRWIRQTSSWQDIPRMVEEDTRTLGSALSDIPKAMRGSRPFDSVGADFLIEAAQLIPLHAGLVELSKENGWTESKAVAKRMRDIATWFDEWFPQPSAKGAPVGFLRISYDPGIVAGDAESSQKKAAEAAAFCVKYLEKWENLRLAYRRLSAKLKLQPLGDGVDSVPDSAEDYLAKISEDSMFIAAMITDLAGLLPALDAERAEISKLPKLDTFDPEEVEEQAVKATLGARDRTMLYNLESGPRPVLVKTGDHHAKVIKNWFGDDAVRVHRFKPFSWETRRSEPLPGWSEKK